MQKANWILKDNEPFSLDFGDYFYNKSQPLEERLMIYVNQAFSHHSKQLNILEFGFGLGINFLLSYKLALEKNIRLHFVACEKFYISKEDLISLAARKNLEFDDDFLASYPSPKEGFWRIDLKNGSTLDLLFGDALECLDELDAKVDVIFADGFSPTKNSDLFSDKILAKAYDLLKKDGFLLSYSANSAFKNSLKNLGFLVQSIPHSSKREATKAIKTSESELVNDGYFYKNSINANKIAIIGSGIAAATLAHQFSKTHDEIVIFEQANELANFGSGNKIGLLSTLIHQPNSILGDFSEFAFLQSTRFLKNLGWQADGVYEHAFSDEMKKRFLSQKDNRLYNFVGDYAYLADGGAVEPKKTCQQIIANSKAKILFQHRICAFKQDENGVDLLFTNGKKYRFDVVIFATGAHSNTLFSNLPISYVRGQVSWLKASAAKNCGISSKSYLTPARDGLCVLGATYDRFVYCDARKSDDSKNLASWKEVFDEDLSPFLIGSRVGYRCYSSDRFAIVGAWHPNEIYATLYKSLQFTKNKKQAKAPVSRIFVDFAHGSRGLASALPAARLIHSQIIGAPSAMPKRFEHALHPARFAIRKLKKGLAIC